MTAEHLTSIQILDIVNGRQISDFTKKLIKYLIEKSEDLTMPVSVTVHSSKPYSFKEICEATGEIEDICGGSVQLNSTLSKQPAKLELSACGGGYEGVHYLRNKSDSCTFWLAPRREEHKAQNVIVTHAEISTVEL